MRLSFRQYVETMLVYSKTELNLLLLVIFGFSAVAQGEYKYNLFGVPGQGYVIEVMIGKPAQTLNVLIDTGSTNFAIAGSHDPNIENYFHTEKSSSLISLKLNVSVLYTQGSWAGQLATDVVYFPTLNSVPKVNCSIAFIMESSNFYMNGSGWQGILGLAYPAISRPNSEIGSWIDSLQQSNNDRTMAFSLTLCGTNDGTRHHGSFEILNNVAYAHEFDGLINVPVLKEWFYEVVIVGIKINNIPLPIDCKDYNTDKTIVDSGTTNLRLPSAIFHMIVSEIISLARLNDIIVDNNFWMQNNVTCWKERMNWDVLPKISIELAKSKNEYTALELAGTSYIRQIASNPTDDAKYCYKFGIEASNTGTILGVVAMEGFQVVFNRTARTVGFRKSACGPNVFISRPVRSKISDINFFTLCSHLHVPGTSMLEIAAYIVCAVLVLAVCMFGYILVQWFKDRYFRGDRGGASVTLSHASLINEDSS